VKSSDLVVIVDVAQSWRLLPRKSPDILERSVDSLNAMARISTVVSATVREGYIHPIEVRDVVARRQAERQQRILVDRACAPLVQQVLREKAETGTRVPVGCGGRVKLLPSLSMRKEVSYLSQ
jgi:hypothetical protein